MCGRFSLGLDPAEIRYGIGEYFPRLRGGGGGGEDPAADPPDDVPDQDAPHNAGASDSIAWEGEDRFRPKNWNVSPRSNSVVMRYRRDREGKTEHVEEGAEESVGELLLQTMQWGLIPHWSKHPPQGPLNTINARSENLTDPGAGGMWQSLKGYKRCVAVVEGYYEWQKKGTTKIPHFTRLAATKSSPHPLMLLAGLWDVVTYAPTAEYPDPKPHYTFTILTTTPCESLKFLHDRMPVILDAEGAERWMDVRGGWTEEVAKLCRPYAGAVECYPVQSEVGKVGTNSSSYIVPVSERKDGIASFFKKQEAKSPAKPKVKTEAVKTEAVKPSSRPATKETEKVHSPAIASDDNGKENDAKQEELKEDGLDAGIGDDSNAPQDSKASVKREQSGPLAKAFPTEKKRKAQQAASHSRTGDADEVVVLDDDEDDGPPRSASKRAKKESAAQAPPATRRQTRSSQK